MFNGLKHPRFLLVMLLLLALVLSSCATSRYGRTYGGTRNPGFGQNQASRSYQQHDTNRWSVQPRQGSSWVKDNNPNIWISQHKRVQHFYRYYDSTITVEKALQRGQRYLPAIMEVFRRKRLPLELAFLPMVESVFINDADSGSARGMWQFTPQTAEHMGLRVGAMVDERLNWRKATEAAAEYLDQLGQRFNYDWALALAAYNGGPGYMENHIQTQRTSDFFRLRLRKETYEYVPKFVAMLQVAKEKFPRLLMARR